MVAYELRNELQVESEVDSFTAERYGQFARHLSPQATQVLDVGCNTGRGGRALKDQRPTLELTGLDCVAHRLARLDPGVYARTICGYATEVPAEDESFDAIVAGEFLEHLYPIDVGRTLSEFFRVLRVGGQLLMTTPNPNDLKRRIRHQTILGGAHVSQHHPRSLRRRLEATGFRQVRLRGSGKTTRYLPERVTPLFAFGSYLAVADKW